MAGGPNRTKNGKMPATKGERLAAPIEGAKAAAASGEAPAQQWAPERASTEHGQVILNAAAAARVKMVDADLNADKIATTIDRVFADKYAANGRMSIFQMSPAMRKLEELLTLQSERAAALLAARRFKGTRVERIELAKAEDAKRRLLAMG